MQSQVRQELSFAEFVDSHEAAIRRGLIAQFGGEAGRDAAAEALLYGLEHWERLAPMDNPAGYLFRVGQRAAKRQPRNFALGVVANQDEAWFEPGLVPALEKLPEKQRVAVVLRHGSDMSYPEIAELTGSSEAAVRKNVERALTSLRHELEVGRD